MKGMEQMLASMLGIDPVALKAQAEKFIAGISVAVNDIQSKISSINSNLNDVQHRLAVMDAKMDAMVTEMGFEDEGDAPEHEASINGRHS